MIKKASIFFIAIIFLIIPMKTFASDATVNITVDGTIKKGEKIKILVNVKNLEKFYAASVDFVYDTSQLKVESIKASEFITKHADNIMELGGETNKNGNTASYSFTFLGDIEGISGSGALAVITAEVLNDNELSIDDNDMKVKLVKRAGSSVEDYSYKFIGYNVSAPENNGENKPEDNNSGEDNNGNGDNNSNNNSSTNEGNLNEDNSNGTNTDADDKQVSTNSNSSAIDKDSSENSNSTNDTNKDESNNGESNKDEVSDNSKEDKEEGNIVKEQKDGQGYTWYILLGVSVATLLSVCGYYLYKNKKNEES